MAYFYFDPDRLAPELDLAGVTLKPRLFFEDQAIWDTALKLIPLIENGLSDNGPYVEALGIVLTHELVRLGAVTGSSETRRACGLAAWQRRRVISYIDEHLAAPIPLATLAGLVHLSPNYFCRAFRQSFGVPPQRYQITQRMEYAKTLLALRGASVTDVGLSVGYSETSAFSTAFRRVTGRTPSAYRMSPT
jgi:AraC family transcriptional regulator